MASRMKFRNVATSGTSGTTVLSGYPVSKDIFPERNMRWSND